MSIGNRLFITNTTIFIWGEKALGELGIYLAFVAGSTLFASMFELQLSKGQILAKKSLALGILLNVILALSIQRITTNIGFSWIFSYLLSKL